MVRNPVLRCRLGRDVVEASLGDGVVALPSGDLEPWRVIRSRRGQLHYPGRYWSAVTGGHVGYESRLELSWLLLNDRDRRLSSVVSQPFQLVAEVQGGTRRHVPDFLAVRDDGLVTVVDVKPRRRLEDPTVAFTFGWTREVVNQQGWGFEVFSEPDPVLLANVRFLAGYRRRRQFDAELLEQALGVLVSPVPFAEGERKVMAGGVGRARVRGHLLHLLWSGRLRGDLGSRLTESSLVVTA